jgi:hypothetical protein
MGRSSNSSHYQLSANRLISRVHVKARFIAAPTPIDANKVEIICTGWNGVKIHCHGRTWDLGKGDSFTSETESAEIMLDVQDARVLVGWPRRARKASPSSLTDSSWDDDNSPTRRVGAMSARGQILQSSPLRVGQRLISPESPTPAGQASVISLPSLFSESGANSTVEVYEDESSSEGQEILEESEASQGSTQAAARSFGLGIDFGASQSSDLSEPGEDDPDEENDPIIHSFGPFGANISSRMASFTAGSPEKPRGRIAREMSKSPERRSSSESTLGAESVPIVNHVVNQLAFSRLSSTPLSVIMDHLPAELKSISSLSKESQSLTKLHLYKLLTAAPSIGEIQREGKDAAGQQLESEYYYIPEKDTDENRRAAVVDGLRKPSLRNCRKQHKVWSPGNFT